MKLYYTFLLLFFAITISYSQEYLKHSTIHFKDASVKTGDFYYYPTLPQSVILIDSLGTKQTYDLSLIDYAEGNTGLFKVRDFEGQPKLFITLVEGKKVSLYKTNFNGDHQLFIFKDSTMNWLEGGEIEFKNNGKTYKKENSKYKGALKFLFGDNEFLVNKIEEIRYSEADIAPMVIAYNKGQISYVKTEVMEKQNMKSESKLYVQYSTAKNVPYYFSNTSRSKYIQMGAKVYASEGSIHSFKFGIEYGKFKWSDGPDTQWLVFNTSYYLDFLRRPHSNMYMGMLIFDAGMIWDESNTDYPLILRFSPLIGYEYHITRKMDFFVEANHLFRFNEFGRNFTFGVTFDLK